jgi:2-haloacid dehalogenase
MAQADDVRASIKVCMFDQYGTVVDMQTGLTEVAAPFLAAKGWQGDPNSFVTWWRRTHFENSMIDALLHREHTPYREIGHRSVAFVLERAGIPYTFDEVRDLVAHIERLRPFPEVPEALARLQTRYPLVVLSNGDPDMLETAKRYHGIPFDRVNSVAVANAFKPQSQPTPKRPRSWGSVWTRCSSSPITPSIASALNLRECERPSSIGVGVPLALPRTSPI